ncbi:MAG: HIT family protein [Candidatus Nomurabacteria bacterium]|nr:HIT family protein [Candidatus Magasanikbacteria bacterium]USN52035.1 MAG: HIT family protein [Candidatus Nomurabacteria bacterium]
MKNTQLFLDIIAGKIPCEKVYEDDHVYAFLDIHPTNKGHVLVVPKKHSENLVDIDNETLSALIIAVKKIAAGVMQATGAQGFNIIQNNNEAAGQVIFHTHFHIIPRFENDGFKHWPGKPYEEGEAKEVAESIRASL